MGYEEIESKSQKERDDLYRDCRDWEYREVKTHGFQGTHEYN